MPAFPELGDVPGDIGEVEVPGQVVAQALGAAHRHVRIAGEVAVYLHCIGRHRQEHREGVKFRRAFVHRIHEGGDVVRQDYLFEKAQGKKLYALPEIVQADVPVLIELGDILPGLDYGAGYQLWEEGYIQRHVFKTLFRLYFSTVYVYGVA